MNVNRHAIYAALLLAGLLAAGCDLQPPPAERRAVSGAISLPSTWKIDAQGVRFKDLPAAIDGNTMTLATATSQYRGGSVTLDLGRPCLFNMITILHGQQPDGHARIVAVYTSNDGKTYKKRYTTAATRSVTYLPILTPIRARYVRLVAEQAGARPWAIAEIYLQ
ncbi:MAG: hypothetical protein GVY16_07225 [Planctomycetes bacterium]|nr:hypothetical protein [Planctomycetota bacterium]